MFDLFVVDFLHEVEIGVWKSLFIHLIRILQEVNPALIHELDRRCVSLLTTFLYLVLSEIPLSFRNMPTFGKATIRRFSANSLEMKKMAARNFEDLLQVSDTSGS